MEVLGKIKEIQQVVEKGTFKSQNVVVTTDEQYPQHISVKFVQDKCEILDKYVTGQNVKVSITLRGREWVSPAGESVYFNTIQGWRIEKLDSQAPTSDEKQDDLPY